MQSRYLALSPNNLVRVILGERLPSDTEQQNVYTRAASHLHQWIASGVLRQDAEPGFYAYYQEFTVPDTGEKLERKGFIGLGGVEDYAAGVVHRHEQTLSGPKKDRMELLRHTHAHFGQIFMLYPDRELAVDALLDQAARSAPTATVVDEYGAQHRLWSISEPDRIRQIQQLMADKKLLIADGHHRYETALAFRNQNPNLAGADRVMMTFVNMYSPGLKILATHRLVSGLPDFDAGAFLRKIGARRLTGLDELKGVFSQRSPEQVRIGIALRNGDGMLLYQRPRKTGELDVRILHEYFLGDMLGISEEAVREEKHLHYIRGLDAACEKLREGDAQVAFLLEPTTIQQVADVAFSGGVMPQKSTDFYPKLLSGLTIYKLNA